MTAAPTLPRPLWEVLAGGDLRLHLHEGQARAWQSEARFIFMLAGTQGGKTSFGPHWLYREIQRKGPGDYLAVTSTFPLLKLKMLPEFLDLFGRTLKLGEWRASDRVFEFHDGKTRVIFGSATHPESLESATAKAAWCDEIGQDEFRLESWEAIQRRLAINRGRVLAGTTLYNVGWLKQQVFERWRDGDADYEVIQFPSTTNPAFPEEEFQRLSRTLDEWKVAMFLKGEYSKPPGLIYHMYEDSYREDGGHLAHPFQVPAAWPRYGGFDFGGVNTARLLIAQDPDADVYYLYDELMAGGKTTAEHAKAAKVATAGMRVISWWGGSKSEDQWRRDMAAAGLYLQAPLVADVEMGIDRVIALLKAYRLYVFDTCRGVRDEFGTYSRDLDAVGEPTEKIKDKEQFHRLDALRYVSQGLTQVGVPYKTVRMAGPIGREEKPRLPGIITRMRQQRAKAISEKARLLEAKR